MIGRVFGQVFSRRVLGKVFNRKVATAVRWKALGPNLSEISRAEYFMARQIGKGTTKLHSSFRRRGLIPGIRKMNSFQRSGWIPNVRKVTIPSRRPAFFHGNQYVKIFSPRPILFPSPIPKRSMQFFGPTHGFRGKLSPRRRRLF